MNDTKRYFVVYVNCVNEIEVELFEATNVKDCIIQFAKSVGDDSRLFRKALMGCETDSEYIEMYKKFGTCVIDTIYAVNNVEYWKNEKENEAIDWLNEKEKEADEICTYQHPPEVV